MKAACSSAVYGKCLSLSNSARKEYTVGQIVNIMTTDANAFQEVIPTLNMIWSMPLQIILALVFLYWELGPAVFGGVAILVLLVPFNIYMGRLSTKFVGKQAKKKDQRIRAMYEILNSIR